MAYSIIWTSSRTNWHIGVRIMKVLLYIHCTTSVIMVLLNATSHLWVPNSWVKHCYSRWIVMLVYHTLHTCMFKSLHALSTCKSHARVPTHASALLMHLPYTHKWPTHATALNMQMPYTSMQVTTHVSAIFKPGARRPQAGVCLAS